MRKKVFANLKYLLAIALILVCAVRIFAAQGIIGESNSNLPVEKSNFSGAVFDKNGKVYLYNEQFGEVKEVAKDGKIKYMPYMSSDRQKVAYAYSKFDNGLKLKVGIVDVNNDKTKEIFLDSRYANSIDSIEWIDSATIGIEGHVNPSTSEYLVVNADDGKVLKKLYGSLFTVLPDRKSVLYKKNKPHGVKEQSPDSLMINETEIFRADNGNTNISYPQISSDFKKIAFIETNR